MSTLGLNKGDKVYFLGICGTGMAAVAGLCQKAGFAVEGSDVGIYPPMSTMLSDLGIKVYSPYSVENIKSSQPKMVVVANALSRGNVEIEHVLNSGIPYTSFPKLLGDSFLKNTNSIVITGTHGKTTTTSLIAHMLTELGADPSFMIGGIPRNFAHGFHLGAGPFFVIEGDEYDTAFFDKGPKFLHYEPGFLILNNLEFDHADIYANVEEIERQFLKLVQLVSDPLNVIVNIDDPGMARVAERTGIGHLLSRVSTSLSSKAVAPYKVLKAQFSRLEGPDQIWSAAVQTPRWGTLNFETTLIGYHNIANIAQALALIDRLVAAKKLENPSSSQLSQSLRSFLGVKRRMDFIARCKGIDIFEDFAHHPTAIAAVIDGFRSSHPGRRLVVAYEPKNATSRRNVFQNDFAKSLAAADRILIGKCPVDQRIPEDKRMDTRKMAATIGAKASCFSENQELLSAAISELKDGDCIIFMSSGSFDGIQHRLKDALCPKS